MRLAFFITPHGFGHAARACAVMAALHRRREACRFDIFTLVPRWFFTESLPACFEYHELLCDVGLVQISPLEADLNRTLDRLESFLPFSPTVIDALAQTVVDAGCRAVVCDISAMGIAVARAAGLPSVLVENFTWDWIYASYAETHRRFGKSIAYLSRQFESVDLHLQTEPVCRVHPDGVRLFPISRVPRLSAGAVRSRLGVPEGASAVLITMGGVNTRHGFLEKLQDRADVCFILPHDVPEFRREGNLIQLPPGSGGYHPDLVGAVDAVVGKLGYSTLAEAAHAGKPYGYIDREGFRESPVLSAYADAHLAAMRISGPAFESAEWIRDLNRLLKMPTVFPLPNGAADAADLILEAVEGTEEGKDRDRCRRLIVGNGKE